MTTDPSPPQGRLACKTAPQVYDYCGKAVSPGPDWDTAFRGLGSSDLNHVSDGLIFFSDLSCQVG